MTGAIQIVDLWQPMVWLVLLFGALLISDAIAKWIGTRRGPR